MGYNTTHIATINSLRRENYNLSMDLDKLTKQKLPTQEEIDGVVLDDNDNEKIRKSLENAYCKMSGITSGFSAQVKGMDVDEYIQNNKERVTNEYKIEKLMGNRPA